MRHFKIRQGNLFETTSEGKRINDKFINPDDNEFASIVTKLADEDNKEFNEIPEMDVWGGLEYDLRGNVVGGYPEEILKIYHADDLMNVHQLDPDEIKSSKTRMAGSPDITDQFLKEIEGESALEKALVDAQVYMEDRAPELDMFRANKKQSYGDIEDELIGLAELKGNVPAPVIAKYDGGEIRKHTRYDINDVTGEREIRPFIDTETGGILKTKFGLLDIRPHTKGGTDDTANEIVALNALKLMDNDNASMNRVDDKHHYADAKRGDRKVEMMISDRGRDNQGRSLDKTTAIPTHTALYPKDKSRTPADVLREPFRNARRQTGSAEKAVQQLERQGKIERTNPTSSGKILRSDINNVGGDPDAVYDELLVTGYDTSLTKGNRDFKSDRLAVAPESIHLIDDLAGLRTALNNNQVRGSRSFINNNFGHNGKGRERARAFDVIPHSSQYVKDITLSHPFTQQLLQQLPVI